MFKLIFYGLPLLIAFCLGYGTRLYQDYKNTLSLTQEVAASQTQTVTAQVYNTNTSPQLATQPAPNAQAEQKPEQRKIDPVTAAYYNSLDKIHKRVWNAMASVKDSTLKLSEMKISIDTYRGIINNSKEIFNQALNELTELNPPAKYASQHDRYRQGVLIASQSMDETGKFFADKDIQHLFAAKTQGEKAKNTISAAYNWIKNN